MGEIREELHRLLRVRGALGRGAIPQPAWRGPAPDINPAEPTTCALARMEAPDSELVFEPTDLLEVAREAAARHTLWLPRRDRPRSA